MRLPKATAIILTVTSKIASILLVLAGLSKSLFYTTEKLGIPRPQILKTQWALSPLPLVFDKPNYYGHYQLTLRYKEQKEVILTAQDLSEIKNGPWHRQVIFAHGLGLIFLSNETILKEFLETYFCNPSAFKKTILPEASPDAVIYRFYNSPDSTPFERTIQCRQ